MAAETMPNQQVLEEFSTQVLDKPEVFLTKSEATAEQAKSITKYLYDLGRSTYSTPYGLSLWKQKIPLA